MRLSAVSDRGLLIIGMLVMVLWGIIFAKRAIVRQAEREHYEFLRTKPAVVPTNPRPKAPQRPSRLPARRSSPSTERVKLFPRAGSNYESTQRREKFLGTLFDSPVNSATDPSFFKVRWKIPLTAEGLLLHHDVEHPQRVQRNVLDCELRRIEAATKESLRPLRG